MISIILRGGLGNNLYMMAVTYIHALKNGFDYAIPMEVENPHYSGQKPYIFPGIKYCEKLPSLRKYVEPAFHYAPLPPIDNILLDGYFQSFKYIDGYRDEILKAFGFKWEPINDWCAIHVRRGDYLNLPDYHPFVGEEYLTAAVAEMNKQKNIAKFKVFSNDIPWCKEFFGGIPEYTFEYVEGGTEIGDMELGSCCEHQILSNGTFATWMHYFNQNPNKLCIGPARWFGKLLEHDIADIYPENCIKIRPDGLLLK